MVILRAIFSGCVVRPADAAGDCEGFLTAGVVLVGEGELKNKGKENAG